MTEQGYTRFADLRLQKDVSKKLLALVDSMSRGGVHPVGGITPTNTVFMLLFSKLMRTYQAVQALVEERFVDEAMSLLRTMIETCVNAMYILNVGGDAQAQRFFDYADYKRYRYAKR